MANNFVLGCAIEAMGEGFSLVRKYGVLPPVFLDVMTDGLFASPAYKVYGKIIAEESYETVGQMAVLGLKDANLALAAGGAVGVPLPSGNVWRDRLVGAVAHGDGGCDSGRHGTRTGPRQRACVVFAGNFSESFAQLKFAPPKRISLPDADPPAPPPGSLSPADRNFRR